MNNKGKINIDYVVIKKEEKNEPQQDNIQRGSNSPKPNRTTN